MKKLTALILGPVALVTTLITLWMGYFVTPADKVQGELARLVYIHPAQAWVALYLSFGTATLASALYLWPRTRSAAADRIAAAAVEVSTVFIALTLITGSIWGRPTWGVWWVWDARLTSTAVLGVLMLGYLALRRANDDPLLRARRSAVFAILTAINVPIVHFSVVWWKTLHQGATVFTDNRHLKIHGSMAWTLLLSFLALSLDFAWLVRARYRVGSVSAANESADLEAALEARRTEAGA